MVRSVRMAVWAAVLLVMMIGLAGCGSKGETAETASPQVSSDVKKEETAQQQAKTRIVKDEFGDVEIPVNPQRVAAIYLEDYLAMLEVKPVVQWYHPNWGKQDYLGLDAPTFDISGSIEALLEQNPDLIIVDGGADAAKYEMYSKVAPTYRLPEGMLTDSPQILKTIADLLGIPEKAESALKKYHDTVADAKEKLEKAVGRETVAVIRLNTGDKTLALFGIENRFTGSILYKELGLEPHSMAKNMKEYQAILSEEVIPELDADHIILFPSNGTWTSEENKEAIQMLEGPLWKSLPAVKNGHVYVMERSHWQSGAFQANLMKVDDILKAMVK
ncbi:ABC transporter substrate-binding protein [Paenibacillus eucommiae]|uniref:ABC-type Fe3+-hydroxamate transport system substrate-binding protein n=1 Tax=Paenibacillus eucommiae TaxID=1355755 RepID=A0ABS4ITU9_9BACL|nr:ABC transporter substrate-binding protein [Paenibacillus eucommiae]MBP1990994.1 ABC-type Fe3+-hydroxamate transport system substrate-binding protein [Paenibacillus eucommiae]